MIPRASSLALALAVLALAGCGADDEQKPSTTSTGTGAKTSTGAEAGKPESARSEGGSTTGAPPPASDLGDEQPTGAAAGFVGRSGSVGPEVIRVPPFVAPTVRLVSGDGGRYAIRIEGKTLKADGANRTASAELPGLQPGRSYDVEVVDGTGGPLRIEASAEPE